MKPSSTALLLGILFIFSTIGYSQDAPDTNALRMLVQQGESYFFSNPDSCLLLAEQASVLAKKLDNPRSELRALIMSGEALRMKGEYSQALERQFRALEIARKIGDKIGEGGTLSLIGWIYVELYEYRQGLNQMFAASEIYKLNPEPSSILFNLSNIGHAYAEMGLLDSALFFQQQAWNQIGIKETTYDKNVQVLIMSRFASVLSRLGKHDQAIEYFHQALQLATLIGQTINLGTMQNWIAESYLASDRLDSSLYYARLSLASARKVSQKLQILDASRLLVKLFRNQQVPDSVMYYQDIAIAMNDSLYGPNKLKQVQLLALREQEQQQYLLQQQERSKNRTRTFALLTILGFIIVIAIILFRNNYRKQKVNVLLRDQKNEIQETLTRLRSTQTQLIQSEKMASLGELTAGIAHEIQNPLNFVNNFSEINRELIDELKEERQKAEGERNSKTEDQVLSDIDKNLEKISFHGKRADAIVKNMLQHSRSSGATRELTDINKLADEYLRLSYHGLRAKDKSFNADFKTELDSSVGKINVIPQDIGRVLLNLINNAFYAVSERERLQASGYTPQVIVRTRKLGDRVEIDVEDNGNGIPQKVVDKIFQPFFTTKPTGQGTGLGLSLSYDIIKAHNGEIKVESREGEGSEFIIMLPIV